MSTVDTHARRMLWFVTLSQQEQRETIQRLSRDGMSDHDIAGATKLSVEMVRQILGRQHGGCEACDE
jgi:hypothetical protein